MENAFGVNNFLDVLACALVSGFGLFVGLMPVHYCGDVEALRVEYELQHAKLALIVIGDKASELSLFWLLFRDFFLLNLRYLLLNLCKVLLLGLIPPLIMLV